jgi:hypothetical protein
LKPEGRGVRSELPPACEQKPTATLKLSLASGPVEPTDPKQRRKAYAAIRSAIKLAEDRDVQVIPIRESRKFLNAIFDDPFERAEVIAAYDHLADLIVFNPDHPAWLDMPRFLREYRGFYSTDHLHHIVRHELGHAAHYRSLQEHERRAIWNADLSSSEKEIGRMVSYRATWSAKEFVAEVFAGLWARISYGDDILSLHNRFRGPQP